MTTPEQRRLSLKLRVLRRALDKNKGHSSAHRGKRRSMHRRGRCYLCWLRHMIPIVAKKLEAAGGYDR
jgi:hypothetical protein